MKLFSLILVISLWCIVSCHPEQSRLNDISEETTDQMEKQLEELIKSIDTKDAVIYYTLFKDLYIVYY